MTATLPADACDCHVHVVAPLARFPMEAGRVYTPPPASPEELLAFGADLGVPRAVIVQPSFYGTDNGYTVEGLKRLGGRARGVAVVAVDVSDAELRDLHAHGMRGARINMETAGSRDPGEAVERLRTLAGQVAPFNWHVQVFAAAPVVTALAPVIADLPCPVVVDHYGMLPASAGPETDDSRALLDLVRTGRVYVKLSAPYRVSARPDFADVAPLARALIEAAPDRMLWGSDWPHTNRVAGLAPTDVHPYRTVDDRAALALVLQACGSDENRRLVFSANPVRLYDFKQRATTDLVRSESVAHIRLRKYQFAVGSRARR